MSRVTCRPVAFFEARMPEISAGLLPELQRSRAPVTADDAVQHRALSVARFGFASPKGRSGSASAVDTKSGRLNVRW
jgi:hypothetical protein